MRLQTILGLYIVTTCLVVTSLQQQQQLLGDQGVGNGARQQPSDLKFEPAANKQGEQAGGGQRIGNKMYSAHQLNMLQQELKGSQFKPVNRNDTRDSYALNADTGQNKPLGQSDDKNRNNNNLLNVGNSINNNNVNNKSDSVNNNVLNLGNTLNSNKGDDSFKLSNNLPGIRSGVKDSPGGIAVNDVDQPENKVRSTKELAEGYGIKSGGDTDAARAETNRQTGFDEGLKNVEKSADAKNDGKGFFDVANSKKAENENPSNVKFIDGEVEKNKPDTQVDSAGAGIAVNGNINNNVIDLNDGIHHDPPQQPVQNFPDNSFGNNDHNNIPRQNDPVEEEKPGSMKVVWDWSDFAVNFEQYVMPEQKIRRAPHATTGEPWPLPQYYITKNDKVYTIDKTNFRFDLPKSSCEIIEKAAQRYKPYILEDAVEDMYDNFQHAQSTMFEEPGPKYETPKYLEAPAVSKVFIKIRKACTKMPHDKMDESYDLFVKRTGIHIWANEVWGGLRGLETLSQLVFKGTNQQLYIRDTVINDYPRFSHRGIHIDSSRHFLFKETIYDVLVGMAQNKMNVLHWHIVDDQSFPFYSSAYPDLSAKGAFHPSFVYMPEDVADIIDFARLRGIRVEPEFDTPGHTYSWGLSRPDILTQCYQGDRPVDGYVGPMDPSKNETFRFLKNFFKDVLHSFKDQYLHLGGDEVPMTCWQSNPEVSKFLAKLEGKSESEIKNADPYYYSYDIRKVLEYYVTRLIKDIKGLARQRTSGVRMVFWQEIMNNNVQLPNDTIIQVWQGGMEEVERAISLGMNVIYSTCWYLDLIEYGTKWIKYYQCDPADSTYGFNVDESKVLGGEACLWSEYVDNENYISTLWPRGSAVAERLWSSKDVRDIESAAARLQEHRCRMLSRGLGVGQISGPDYCLRRGRRRHQVNETSGNCTQSTCGGPGEKNRVEVENIKVEFEQKGGLRSDCSQGLNPLHGWLNKDRSWKAVIQAGGQLTMVLLVLVLIAVMVMLTISKKKITQVRMCKNKTILLVFITLILLYFMCYTSIWMQAIEFKGSIEKRKSSNINS